MATQQAITKYVKVDVMKEFSRVTAQIERIFNQLIDQLTDRKKTLLQKIILLQEDCRVKESARECALQELEKAQEELKQLRLTEQEPATKVCDEGVGTGTPIDHPSLSFSCPTREKIEKLIENFGELVQTPNYSIKMDPILSASEDEEGVGYIGNPTGLALDEASHKVYISDHKNSCIQVFSFQADFITQFGKGTIDKPFGIATTEDHILVTDNELHSMFRFDKTSLQLRDKAGGKFGEKNYLDDPRGLTVDTNGDIFIVDNSRWLVLIFSQQLEFLSTIGGGTLDYPLDVKLTAEAVIVLNWSDKCIHIFARSGQLLTSLLSHDWGHGIFGGDGEYLVKNPYFFCLDRANNFIISDKGNHEIKIVDNSGELIHTLGRDFLYAPMGIALSEAGRVYVAASIGTNFALLAF